MSLRLNGSSQAESETNQQPSRRSRFSAFLDKSLKRKQNRTFQPAPETVGSLVRETRVLFPTDLVGAAHDALRKSSGGGLYVAKDNQIIGFLSLAQLNSVLGALPSLIAPDLSVQSLSMLLDNEPAAIALGPPVVLRSNEPISHIRTEFELRPDLPLIAVTEPDGRYVGTVLRSDLIAADLGNLAPLRVGGMATPLGVYLTDGVNQGGAGNLGLFLTGVSMALRFIAAIFVANVILLGLNHRFRLNLVQSLANQFLSLTPSAARNIASDLQGLLVLPLVMIFIRLSPLAGIHAAEHQTVHCMERGEPLLPDTVKQMPRAHPRCGTNLMAGVMIFDIAVTILYAMTSSISEAVIPSILITLALWRPVGTFLQNYLTTRPASLRQIESGIKAGRQVMQKHWTGLEKRSNLPLRIWNMGLIQVLLGSWLVIGIFDLALQFFPALARYVGQI